MYSSPARPLLGGDAGAAELKQAPPTTDFLMPEYFDLLRMADLHRVFGSEFGQMLKGGGPSILLALLLLLASWVSFVGGIIFRSKTFVAFGFFSAVLTAATGWLGSYLGYLQVAAVVAASGQTPKQSQLLSGANVLAWSALVPSAACIATIAVMLVFTFATARKLRRAVD